MDKAQIVALLQKAVKELKYAVRMATVRNEPSLPYLQQALAKAEHDLSIAQQ